MGNECVCVCVYVFMLGKKAKLEGRPSKDSFAFTPLYSSLGRPTRTNCISNLGERVKVSVCVSVCVCGREAWRKQSSRVSLCDMFLPL